MASDTGRHDLPHQPYRITSVWGGRARRRPCELHGADAPNGCRSHNHCAGAEEAAANQDRQRPSAQGPGGVACHPPLLHECGCAVRLARGLARHLVAQADIGAGSSSFNALANGDSCDFPVACRLRQRSAPRVARSAASPTLLAADKQALALGKLDAPAPRGRSVRRLATYLCERHPRLARVGRADSAAMLPWRWCHPHLNAPPVHILMKAALERWRELLRHASSHCPKSRRPREMGHGASARGYELCACTAYRRTAFALVCDWSRCGPHRGLVRMPLLERRRDEHSSAETISLRSGAARLSQRVRCINRAATTAAPINEMRNVDAPHWSRYSTWLLQSPLRPSYLYHFESYPPSARGKTTSRGRARRARPALKFSKFYRGRADLAFTAGNRSISTSPARSTGRSPEARWTVGTLTSHSGSQSEQRIGSFPDICPVSRKLNTAHHINHVHQYPSSALESQVRRLDFTPPPPTPRRPKITYPCPPSCQVKIRAQSARAASGKGQRRPRHQRRSQRSQRG